MIRYCGKRYRSEQILRCLNEARWVDKQKNYVAQIDRQNQNAHILFYFYLKSLQNNSSACKLLINLE